MSQDKEKKAAAERAASYIQDHSIVGIGTGSTVYYFIEKLIEKVKNGLDVQAVFSSKKSEEQALKGGIKTLSLDKLREIDITVDGADEIDNKFQMIKGGGGALFREKILASSSKKMIVIVDHSKVVDTLGKCVLPIEVLPFGVSATLFKLEKLSYVGSLREQSPGNLFITDNGNYIFDIKLREPAKDAKTLHQKLIEIPGVIETGLFFDVSKHLIIGNSNGTVQERTL